MACTPAWTKGAVVPVLPYDSDGSCAGPAGGTKTVAVPPLVLDVTNPPDFTWRDEDYTPVQSDDDGSVWLFDNV